MSQPSARPRFLAIAHVLRPWGVRGEVKAEILTEDPDRFQWLETIYLEPDFQAHRLESARLHGGAVCLKLADCNDRDAAELLRGRTVYVPIEDALPLEEGEFWVHQILGLEVWSTDGQLLGVVQEVLDTSANDVYVVRSQQGREVLIPALMDVVLDIDLESGRMLVRLPEGLI